MAHLSNETLGKVIFGQPTNKELEVVVSYLKKYLYDPKDPDRDFEQAAIDVIVKVRESNRDRKNIEKMKAYLVRAAVNRSVDLNRKSSVESEEQFTDDLSCSVPAFDDQVLDRAEHDEMIQLICSKLSKEESELFLNYFLREVPLKNIAETLKIKESTLKTKVYRLRQKVIKIFQDLDLRSAPNNL